MVPERGGGLTYMSIRQRGKGLAAFLEYTELEGKLNKFSFLLTHTSSENVLFACVSRGQFVHFIHQST